MCTSHRWLGNNKGRFKPKEEAQIKAFKIIMKKHEGALRELANS